MAHALPQVITVAALGRSVLIVDDDDDWRAIAADLLTDAGFVVTTAANGRAGLASWRRARAQVVVTDFEMPLMDGCGLLAALHSIDPSLPVIVLTAEDVANAASAFPGAFRIIQKPVPNDAVVSAVTEAFSCPRRRGARRMARTARAVLSFGRGRDRQGVLNRSTRAQARLAFVAGFGAAAVAAAVIAAVRASLV